MKTSPQLVKKLSAYSLFAGVFLTTHKSDAQIVYTDVVPDDTLSLDSHFDLDLNNDGISDFRIILGGSNQYKYAGIALVDSYYAFGNVLSDGDDHIPYFPGKLDQGYSICPAGLWLGLAQGDAYGYRALAYWYSPSSSAGDWTGGVTDKFLGLKLFLTGNQSLQGWLRLDVLPHLANVIVKDYAFNSTPNGCISAGEGIPADCVDNYEPNNSSSQAMLIAVNQKVNALIGEAGDKDWFQFTPDANKNNVRIVLKSLPKNYNIKLYDQNLNVLGSSQHHFKVNDTIVYNNLDATQHYYVQVKGVNQNVFDATDCYTLKVEANTDPYKLIEESTADEENDVQLFPTLATNQLSISGIDGEWQLAVFDLSGRNILNQKISASENFVNVSSLADGMYLLQVKNENEMVVRKFEVQR